LAHDGQGTPQDYRGDEQREHRVNPVEIGEVNHRAAHDDRCGGEGVAEHVQEDAADVDVTGELPEHSGNDSVHHHTGRGDDHHHVRVDLDRYREAMDGSDGEPDGKRDQCERVDEAREHAGALIAEGTFVSGGAGL